MAICALLSWRPCEGRAVSAVPVIAQDPACSSQASRAATKVARARRSSSESPSQGNVSGGVAGAQSGPSPLSFGSFESALWPASLPLAARTPPARPCPGRIMSFPWRCRKLSATVDTVGIMRPAAFMACFQCAPFAPFTVPPAKADGASDNPNATVGRGGGGGGCGGSFGNVSRDDGRGGGGGLTSSCGRRDDRRRVFSG